MPSTLANEGLFTDSAFFAEKRHIDEIVDLFKFSERRVLLGEGALADLADECQRLGATRVRSRCE